MHYKRVRKHGTTDAQPRRVSPICDFCDTPSVARRLCQKHYAQWKAHGDPAYADKLRANQEPIVLNRHGYLQRRGMRTVENGQKLIHREIANALPGEHVHHINGIKTDNRRENLWVCSSQSEHTLAHKSLQDAAFVAVKAGLIEFADGRYELRMPNALAP